MASNTRMANTVNERALRTAAEKKDVKTLTSLLRKGVFPNVHDNVCRHEKKRERECEEEREEEEGGEMREREFRTLSLLFLNVNILFRTL